MDRSLVSQQTKADHSKAVYFVVTILASVLAGALLRYSLTYLLGGQYPFITYFLVIIFVAWRLGFTGGATATVLAAIVSALLSPAAIASTQTHGSATSASIIFIVEGLAISFLGQSQLIAKLAAEASARSAESRLQELLASQENLRIAIDEAQTRARRADSLNTIGKAIRDLRTPDEVQQIALNELATTLAADRCIVIFLDKGRDLVSFVSEYHRPHLPDIFGEYSLTDFDVDLDEMFPRAAPLVVSNVDDPAYFSQKSASMLKSLQISSLIDVPMSHGGQVVSVLGVYMAETTRVWTTDEVSFVEAVASQLRGAIDANRVLSEAQNRADREALVNQIGSAMRIVPDPEEIQERAVTMLGRALNADRCYFAVYDLVNSEVAIGRDWHRPDLPSVHGVHHFSNTKEMFYELYPLDSTSVVADRDKSSLSEQTIENMKSLQIRARVSVAVADSKGMATLTAIMSDKPRAWTADDVELIEKVASQLRPTVEMARAQMREHRIATDLQAALLPAVPTSIPGLAIGTCMMPALDEAEIGGDFCDVFPLDNVRYAFVVGDVSGKGLAAAAQLATVRNSLRMSLYQTKAPAESAHLVNSVLTGRALLSGFVTVLVAVYNSENFVLTYTSCGHEPAMIWRAKDKAVEMLACEGVPIGVDESAAYIENTIMLQESDSLLMYTDGVSESGVRRTQLLGHEGLAKIFGKVAGTFDVASAANSITDDAKAFAGGTFRDDVCVLFARRQ